jgi:PhnB protein
MATTVNIYLNFNGNCEEAFNFYRSVFGGEFPYVGRFGEMPADQQLNPADANKIMHISLPISEETILLGSDTGAEWAPNFKQGNNFSISVGADTTAEAEKIFNALSVGGTVTMPLAKTFWSDAFGMLTDKFGINWMVSLNSAPQK